MQLCQDQSPAAVTRIVIASYNDTLITLNNSFTLYENTLTNLGSCVVRLTHRQQCVYI